MEEFRNRRLSEAELMQVLDSGTVRVSLRRAYAFNHPFIITPPSWHP